MVLFAYLPDGVVGSISVQVAIPGEGSKTGTSSQRVFITTHEGIGGGSECHTYV